MDETLGTVRERLVEVESGVKNIEKRLVLKGQVAGWALVVVSLLGSVNGALRWGVQQ